MQRGPAPSSSVKPAAQAPAQPFPAQPAGPVASTSKAAPSETCVTAHDLCAEHGSPAARPPRRFVIEESSSSFPVLSLAHASTSPALGRRSFGSFNRDVEVCGRSLDRADRPQKLAKIATDAAAVPDESDSPLKETAAAPSAAAPRPPKPKGFIKPGAFPSEKPADRPAPKVKRPAETDPDAATTARAEAKAEKKRRKLASRAAAAATEIS